MLASVVKSYKSKEVTVVKKKKERAASNRAASVVKADRDESIFHLRLAGMSTDMIARQTGESPSYINTMIRGEIQRINDQCKENAQEIQDMELRRLDMLMQIPMEHALNGDYDAISMVLRLMDQRAKYLGIYAGSKLEIKGEAVKQYVGIDLRRL